MTAQEFRALVEAKGMTEADAYAGLLDIMRERLERSERQAEALAKAVEQVFAVRDTWAGESGTRCVCGCDDDVEVLRAALSAYREGR